MNIIPNGQKVLMVDERTNTTYGGSAALQAMQTWYTMGDLAMSASSPLSFTWTKEQVTDDIKNEVLVRTYLLGINFNNLVIEDGVNYTLLLDRYKPQESKNSSGRKVKARFAHEELGKSITNGRLSEIPITSANGQFFDFNMPNYFKWPESPNDSHNGGTGFSIYRGKTRNAWGYRFVNLGFRIRTEKNGIITETGILGTIAVNKRFLGGNFTISYARPNS